MRPKLPKRIAFFAATWIVYGALLQSADAAALVPHRALYEMRLSFSDSVGPGVSAARGAMSYEFRDACEGWSVKSSVYLRLRRGGGPEVESVRTMVSWEAKNGLDYRFRVSESLGGQSLQEFKGIAILDGVGQVGVAEFTAPKSVSLKLPAGTIFPTAHIAAMIDGKDGTGRHLGKIVFDGTNLDNPYQVSALLNTRPSGKKYPESIAEVLQNSELSGARLAYYPFYKTDKIPEFELAVDYRPDGIVSRLLQDLGDYGIEARLQHLEMLPLDKC